MLSRVKKFGSSAHINVQISIVTLFLDSVTKLSRRPPLILDGRFFKIVNFDPTGEGVPVSASCLSCDRVLKGRFDPTSNFIKHLKVADSLSLANSLSNLLRC